MAKLIKIGHNWYSDFRQDGKRIRRALSPYKERAQVLLDDLLAIRKSGKDGTQPQAVSWFYFREKCLQFFKEFRNSKTHDSIKLAFDMVEQYGRPLTQLNQMNPDYMEDFLLKCRAKKIPEKTILGYLRRLKTGMKWAEARGLVQTQTWTLIKTPPDAPRVDYLDYEQLDKILDVCQGHWKTAAMLMAYAGLRSGEVRNLEWEDIDFKNRLIHIRAKVGWTPKGSKPGKPKNRVVDLLERLENYLKTLSNRSGYVVGGDLLKKNTYGQFFRRLTDEVGFKVYAHKFRHTFASFMISGGIKLEKIGPLMGHTDVRSTQIYAHLMPHARREAMDQLEASLPPVTHFKVIAANE